MRPCLEMTYPEFSGCYALMAQGQVVYVGQSRNVLYRLTVWRNRLRRYREGKNVDYVHQSGQIVQFDRVRMYPCASVDLRDLEAELIALYNPRCNIQVPKLRKGIDIYALAKQAGLDVDKWKAEEKWKTSGDRVYQPRAQSPKPLPVYRRI